MMTAKSTKEIIMAKKTTKNSKNKKGKKNADKTFKKKPPQDEPILSSEDKARMLRDRVCP